VTAAESYPVKPGGFTAVDLEPGDEITVIDRDGRQPAELTVLGDFAALAAAPDTTARVLTGLGGQPGKQGHEVVAALAARGLDPSAARAISLFGESSPAGETASFTASRAVTCVLAVPAQRMEPGGWQTPSPVLLKIKRLQPRPAPAAYLPPPLADPILDLRVDRATALAYEVRPGQYIQIIDVAGKQCSDFLAFDSDALAAGTERGLDLTATRYFMGSAYPRPGLHGKFYGPDLRPLVEVVRDTVGRHDTFGLACNAKYYADMGYPGHANCTDNFNTRLAPYGIAPRQAWAALNLFYNTFFDASYQLLSDEPWSRPGDYVLLRALTMLVCASSACPDDIDPANGWNPTDIHVRVYDAADKFSVAIARRVTPVSEPELTRETGFHPRTSALARRMTEYRGYWLPSSYDGYGAVAEYWACRERAAVMDLSPLRKFEVTGPDAESLLQASVTRDIRRLSVGQVVYTAMCADTGGTIDDATVFRLGPDNFRFVGGDPYDGVWLRSRAGVLGLSRAWVKESTDQLHNIAVQGPASRDILRDLVWTPEARPAFESLTWFRFTVGKLSGSDGIPVLVSRTGYSGELGYEVWCHPSDAVAVWDMVWEAGQPYGLAPLGLEALDMLRIEAGLAFGGYEFDDQVDPFEAGIGFTVPLKSKEEDFCGRAALLRRHSAPQRVLVGLVLDGNETASHGDCVHVGRLQVGVVTSGTRSPVLRQNIALCRMAVEYSPPGTCVEVGKLDGHSKRIPATVVRFPFYDPEKTKPKSLHRTYAWRLRQVRNSAETAAVEDEGFSREGLRTLNVAEHDVVVTAIEHAG
jgi:aminomethyltransferase